MGYANVAYIRVSTLEQNTSRQLADCPVKFDRVFEEKASGKNIDGRPVLKEMMGFLREGDHLYIHEMSRLGRNTRDLLNLLNDITDKGVTLHFWKEQLVFSKDENNPVSNLLFSLLSAISTFERNLLLQRQKEGIAQAKKRGVYSHRPKRITEEKYQQVEELLKNSRIPITEALKQVGGISRSQWYLHLKQQKQNASKEPQNEKA